MSRKSHWMQLKAIPIALPALILIFGSIVATEKPDHTKAEVSFTVIKGWLHKKVGLPPALRL